MSQRAVFDAPFDSATNDVRRGTFLASGNSGSSSNNDARRGTFLSLGGGGSRGSVGGGGGRSVRFGSAGTRVSGPDRRMTRLSQFEDADDYSSLGSRSDSDCEGPREREGAGEAAAAVRWLPEGADGDDTGGVPALPSTVDDSLAGGASGVFTHDDDDGGSSDYDTDGSDTDQSDEGGSMEGGERDGLDEAVTEAGEAGCRVM
jgi:hypothetical protein